MKRKIIKETSSHFINCIGIVSPFRSGNNLLTRLFDGHPELHTNHSETFLSVFSTPIEKSIYKINILKREFKEKNIKKIFHSLFFNDSKHKISSKIGWVKTNYNDPIQYNYDYIKHYKFFKKYMKNNLRYDVRYIYNSYVEAFFKSFDDYEVNKEIRNYCTLWPNFCCYKRNIKNFFHIYPKGKLIYIVRNPKDWIYSCFKRKPFYLTNNYIKRIYTQSIKNILDKKYIDNIIIIDFNDLILKKKIIKKILDELNLKNSYKLIYQPTIKKQKIISNSIIRENQTFHINKEVIRKNHDLDFSKYKLEKLNMYYFKILKKAIKL